MLLRGQERPAGVYRVSTGRAWVEAGCETFGDVVGVLNAGVSLTLGKGIGVACTDMAAPCEARRRQSALFVAQKAVMWHFVAVLWH